MPDIPAVESGDTDCIDFRARERNMMNHWMRAGLCGVVCLAAAASCVAQETGEKSPQVAVGSPAPDFTMTGIDGEPFKLSDKLGKHKHLVLIFSRAHW